MPSIIQADQLKSANGVTTYLNNGTLSNLTFPRGHVIQTVTDQHNISSNGITVTTTANDFLGSDLQCTITPQSTGNKLFISAFIPSVYNNATSTHGLLAGFAYDADFSSGNGTTIGPRASIADHESWINSSTGMVSNLNYFITVTVGTNAPSAGSETIIRPIFQTVNGNVLISSNGASYGVFSMIVMEIQA